MSIKFIEEAELLMASSGEDIKSNGGASDDVIYQSQNILGIKFPDDYIFFLKKYGTLAFNGCEFYGLTKSGLKAESIPCVIFATKTARQRGDISDTMIKIKSSGYGPSFCIDMDENSPYGIGSVVETTLFYKENKEVSLEANSFSEFFLNEIKYSLE